MKLLLTQDVDKLGMVGDVVDVKEGYARNYLLPVGIAVEPTPANLKAIAAARAKAAEARAQLEKVRRQTAERLANIEVTIKAAANEEGHLYGSVGPREIAAALRAEGHSVDAHHVQLHEPIRHLDNIPVEVRFAEDIRAEIKVWVVRETGGKDSHEEASRAHATGGDQEH